LSNLLDVVRILAVCAAFFFGYQIGFQNGYDPVAQLHFMIPILVSAVAGISGLEGLLFPEKASAAKGFQSDGNYQRQTAIALLSYTAVALLVTFAGWGLYAELTILFAFCFFFFFSGINHAADAIKNKNYRWQNINRPFITLLMIAGLAYPVAMALK
ncbi:MAG: hypothetical protein GX418_03485, partial [Clostridiales bacterium]|nr:hypothetical protein [Clostridiales bacterium]